MLKPIVEQMHRTGESVLGQPARQIAIVAHEHRHTRQRPRQHLRLVTRRLDRRQYARTVADDHDTVAGLPLSVAARQNCRPLSLVEQPLCERRHHRRLAAAADDQIADADHGTVEAPLRLRVTRVPRAPKACRPAVNSAERIQWITRKGRTTPGRPRSRGGNTSATALSVLSFAPRFASTSARAAAPSRARRTGSPIKLTTTSSSSRGVRTWIAAPSARNTRAIS